MSRAHARCNEQIERSQGARAGRLRDLSKANAANLDV